MQSRSRSRSEEAPKSKKIYISNLSAQCTENDLRTRFGDYGNITDVNIKDKNGVYFAFVEFDSPREASKAVDDVNQKEFQGKTLKVELARGRPAGGYNNRFGGGRGGRDNYRNDYGGDRRGAGGFRDREGGDRNGGSRQCFNCHGVGHFARDCTKPRQPREGGFRGGRDRDFGGDRRRDYDRGDRERGDRRDKDRDYDRRDKEDRRRRSRSGSGQKRRKDRNDDY